jgi:hypothetical protein
VTANEVKAQWEKDLLAQSKKSKRKKSKSIIEHDAKGDSPFRE